MHGNIVQSTFVIIAFLLKCQSGFLTSSSYRGLTRLFLSSIILYRLIIPVFNWISQYVYDLSVAYAKYQIRILNTKTQFFLITFDFVIHFKKENFFLLLSGCPPLFKVYKEVVKFSFTQQKIFRVLVFTIRIWYLAYPMDRSINN